MSTELPRTAPNAPSRSPGDDDVSMKQGDEPVCPVWVWTAAVLVVLVCAAFNVRRALLLAPFIDEVLTYAWFTHWSFSHAITYYPEPNNHLLHTAFVWALKHLPVDPLIGMRLPALVVGLSGVLLAHVLLLRRFGFPVGIFCSCLFSSAYVVSYYTWQSRGYIYTIVSALIGFELILQLVDKGWQRRHFWFFVGAQSLGLAAIPAHAYAVATCVIVALVIGNRRAWRPLVLSLLATGVVTGLFYLPVILESGLRALLLNPFVHPRSYLWIRYNLPYFYGTVYHHDQVGLLLLGIPAKPVIASLVVLLGALVLRNARRVNDSPQARVGLAVLVALLLPYFLVTLHRVLTYERVWAYIIIFLVYGIGVLLSLLPFRARGPFSRAAVLLVGLGAMVAAQINFDVRNPAGIDERSAPMYALAQDLARETDTSYFFGSSTIVQQCYIMYALLRRGTPVHVDDEVNPGQPGDAMVGFRVNDFDEDLDYDVMVISRQNGEALQRMEAAYAPAMSNDYVVVMRRRVLP